LDQALLHDEFGSRQSQPDVTNIRHAESNQEVERNLASSNFREQPEHPVLQLFLEQRRKFLNFVRSSVHDLDEAEEILQRASLKISLKIINGADGVRDAERSEAWIYRILRNEVADYFRRRAAQSRRITEFSPEDLSDSLVSHSFHQPEFCPCAMKELPKLHPNYSDVLRSVDINGEAILSHAQRKGISVNSATVRLHRARKSLRVRLETRCGTCAGAGCFDCRCGQYSMNRASARKGRS
jgi:DNA-directed RNA polymerase specialized sigma24 family protein